MSHSLITTFNKRILSTTSHITQYQNLACKNNIFLLRHYSAATSTPTTTSNAVNWSKFKNQSSSDALNFQRKISQSNIASAVTASKVGRAPGELKDVGKGLSTIMNPKRIKNTMPTKLRFSTRPKIYKGIKKTKFSDEVLFAPLPPNTMELDGKIYKKNDFVKTNSRSSKITMPMVGFTVHVHNGKTYYPIRINEEMIGHRLGEFAITKKRAVWKKKDKR